MKNKAPFGHKHAHDLAVALFSITEINSSLTKRELEAVEHILKEGRDPNLVAQELGITRPAVVQSLKSAKKKLLRVISRRFGEASRYKEEVLKNGTLSLEIHLLKEENGIYAKQLDAPEFKMPAIAENKMLKDMEAKGEISAPLNHRLSGVGIDTLHHLLGTGRNYLFKIRNFGEKKWQEVVEIQKKNPLSYPKEV